MVGKPYLPQTSVFISVLPVFFGGWITSHSPVELVQADFQAHPQHFWLSGPGVEPGHPRFPHGPSDAHAAGLGLHADDHWLRDGISLRIFNSGDSDSDYGGGICFVN